MKRIITNVTFSYRLTDDQYRDYGDDDIIGMAIDAFINPEPGEDEYTVTAHDVVDEP